MCVGGDWGGVLKKVVVAFASLLQMVFLTGAGMSECLAGAVLPTWPWGSTQCLPCSGPCQEQSCCRCVATCPVKSSRIDCAIVNENHRQEVVAKACNCTNWWHPHECAKSHSPDLSLVILLMSCFSISCVRQSHLPGGHHQYGSCCRSAPLFSDVESFQWRRCWSWCRVLQHCILHL